MQILKSIKTGKISLGSSRIAEKIKSNIGLIVSAGYDGVELSGSLKAVEERHIIELKKYIESEGIIVGIHIPIKFEYKDADKNRHNASLNLCNGFCDESVRASEKHLNDYIRIAEMLGAKYLNTHMEGLYDTTGLAGIKRYSLTYDEQRACNNYWWKINKKNQAFIDSHISNLQTIISGTDIPVLIENHELSYHLSRPEDIEVLKRKNCGFLFDIGHPFKQMSNVENRIDWGLNKINNEDVYDDYRESIGIDFASCTDGNCTEYLSRYLKTRPLAMHIHQINTSGKDHLPLFERGIFDIEIIKDIVAKARPQIVTVESFYNNHLSDEYREKINREFGIIKGIN